MCLSLFQWDSAPSGAHPVETQVCNCNTCSLSFSFARPFELLGGLPLNTLLQTSVLGSLLLVFCSPFNFSRSRFLFAVSLSQLIVPCSPFNVRCSHSTLSVSRFPFPAPVPCCPLIVLRLRVWGTSLPLSQGPSSFPGSSALSGFA